MEGRRGLVSYLYLHVSPKTRSFRLVERHDGPLAVWFFFFFLLGGANSEPDCRRVIGSLNTEWVEGGGRAEWAESLNHSRRERKTPRAAAAGLELPPTQITPPGLLFIFQLGYRDVVMQGTVFLMGKRRLGPTAHVRSRRLVSGAWSERMGVLVGDFANSRLVVICRSEGESWEVDDMGGSVMQTCSLGVSSSCEPKPQGGGFRFTRRV